MQQPEGFQEDPSFICRLKKSLYGLKQAPGLGMQKWMLSCFQLASQDANQTLMCIFRKMMLTCRSLFFMLILFLLHFSSPIKLAKLRTLCTVNLL